jgi:tetratricopeptide (TPR) repeat protein
VVFAWNWIQSELEFHRALDLDADNAYTHYLNGFTNLPTRGRFDEAIAEGRLAIALDPFSPYARVGLCNTLLWARQYHQAVEACNQALELERDFVPAHITLAATYYLSGRVDLAIAESERLVALRSSRGPVFLARSDAVAGRRKEA